jgi:UDP-glucose 4-epimerase
MEATRTALVTGGAGFIGSHLTELLLADGWEVYALDDLSTGSQGNVAHLRDRRDYHLVVDSVLNQAVVSELVHRCDVVFHLAAAVGVRLIVEQPVRTLVTNIQGTETVLEYCNRFGRRVLVASTSEVYGDHREEKPLEENARRVYGPTTEKRWGYADSKAIDEFLALAYHQERGLDCVIVRLFNTVGPRQTGRYGMVLPTFVRQALTDQPITVFGDGTQSRSFTHVSDVVRALIALVNEPKAIGQVINIGNTEEVTMRDLAERVREVTGSSSEIKLIPYDEAYESGFEDMPRRLPDLSKIHAMIGYTPRHTLDDILGDVVEYFRGL